MAAVHPDDRAAYDAFMAAQKAGEEASVEYRLCGGDGVTRWMRERSKSQLLPGGAIEVIGIATDISSSRAAAAALAASEAKLEHVLKAVDAYVYVLEARRGRRLAHDQRQPQPRAVHGRRRRHGEASRPTNGSISSIPTTARTSSARPRRSQLGTQFEASYRLVGYDGVERWVIDRNVPYDTGDGRNVRLGLDARRQRPAPARAAPAVERRPAARRQRRARQLRMQAEQQARTDVVTGAHNRLALSEHVALALEAGHEGGLVLLRPRPLQAGQRRARARRRRPRARRGRAPARARPRARTTASPAGAARSSPCSSASVGDEQELARRAVELQRAIDSAPFAVDGERLTVEVSGGATPLTAGREPRRAGRAGRPGALRGQAPRPQPRAAGERAHRERSDRRAPRGDPHRRGARRRGRRARGRVRRTTPRTSRPWRRASPATCISTRARRCAASWAAGCTTSASSRCPSACCSSR